MLEEPAGEFRDDDNLIIKGNNLVALSSLLERYEGKVKLIYIDPPYYFNAPKPSDAFKYNSNFKLSTWLLFMKNRISIAKRLLSKDGVLLCHMNEDGFAWMKILLGELLGEKNFIETFIWKNTDNPDSLSNKSRSSVEYIICFENKKDSSVAYVGKETENSDTPLLNTGNNRHSLSFPAGTIHFSIPDGKYAAGKTDRVIIKNHVYVVNGLNANEVTLYGEFRWKQETVDEEIRKGTYFLVKSEKFSIRFQRADGGVMAPEKFIDDQYLSKTIGVGTNEDANAHVRSLEISFDYSKPESVIAFFIRAITKDRDIVLDFFVGSGTTAAVAHKMNRRYIGVEQMDYIEDVTVERLKKVIEGEQGGISEAVNWQGGGSFVYCELLEDGARRVHEIEAATETTIDQLKEAMYRDERIVPYLSAAELQAADEDFAALSLEEKKRVLIALINKNKLYVNASSMEDEEYRISDEDKAFTRSFYKGGHI